MTSSAASTMRAITVRAFSEAPLFTSTAPKPIASPGSETTTLRVLASGLHNLVRSQSTGKHYTTTNATLPYTPGSDGVGVTDEGQMVYFNSMATGGGFAEYINVPTKTLIPIPIKESSTEEEKQTLATTIAGLMNPAMSSFMALTTRTTNLPPDFTVLILGVTSMSGQLAIPLARSLGAKTIIGAARSKTSLASIPDLDETILLTDNPIESTDFRSILSKHNNKKIDVILDYIWGPTTLHVFNSLPASPPEAHDLETQYIQIGSLSGPEITNFPSSLLRSKNLTIRGAGPGAWSTTRDVAMQYPRLLQKFVDGVVGGGNESHTAKLKVRKLENVKEAWDDKGTRTVFVM